MLLDRIDALVHDLGLNSREDLARVVVRKASHFTSRPKRAKSGIGKRISDATNGYVKFEKKVAKMHAAVKDAVAVEAAMHTALLDLIKKSTKLTKQEKKIYQKTLAKKSGRRNTSHAVASAVCGVSPGEHPSLQSAIEKSMDQNMKYEKGQIGVSEGFKGGHKAMRGLLKKKGSRKTNKVLIRGQGVGKDGFDKQITGFVSASILYGASGEVKVCDANHIAYQSKNKRVLALQEAQNVYRNFAATSNARGLNSQDYLATMVHLDESIETASSEEEVKFYRDAKQGFYDAAISKGIKLTKDIHREDPDFANRVASGLLLANDRAHVEQDQSLVVSYDNEYYVVPHDQAYAVLQCIDDPNAFRAFAEKELKKGHSWQLADKEVVGRIGSNKGQIRHHAQGLQHHALLSNAKGGQQSREQTKTSVRKYSGGGGGGGGGGKPCSASSRQSRSQVANTTISAEMLSADPGQTMAVSGATPVPRHKVVPIRANKKGAVSAAHKYVCRRRKKRKAKPRSTTISDAAVPSSSSVASPTRSRSRLSQRTRKDGVVRYSLKKARAKKGQARRRHISGGVDHPRGQKVKREGVVKMPRQRLNMAVQKVQNPSSTVQPPKPEASSR